MMPSNAENAVMKRQTYCPGNIGPVITHSKFTRYRFTSTAIVNIGRRTIIAVDL